MCDFTSLGGILLYSSMSKRNAGSISAMSGLNHWTSFEGLGFGCEAAVDAMILSIKLHQFQSSTAGEGTKQSASRYVYLMYATEYM